MHNFEIHPLAKIIKASYQKYETDITEIIFISSNVFGVERIVYQKKRYRKVLVKDYYSFSQWILCEDDYML